MSSSLFFAFQPTSSPNRVIAFLVSSSHVLFLFVALVVYRRFSKRIPAFDNISSLSELCINDLLFNVNLRLRSLVKAMISDKERAETL